MEHEGDGATNCNWCARNDPQRFGKGTGRLENQRNRKDRANYSIFKIGQNTEKSPGELRRLSVTQNPVKENS